MSIPECRKLGKKEADQFRSLVNFYETKQYKKGIKAADTILKKYPDHGETQAMKGLIYNSMGNKDEALELVKLGVRNDMKSHVTWHVYGIYHKSNRHYKEAAKCYLNALRWDKENMQILRDLSHLQIHMRDMAGFVETRRQILVLKPELRSNWLGFAVGQFKAGNYSEANDIVNNYLNSSKDKKEDVTQYEQGELLLFQNQCLVAEKKYDEAISHFDKNEADIPDKLSIRKSRAELLTLKGDHESAQLLWHELVEEQPMNYRFHCGYQISLLKLDFDTAVEMFSLERHHLPCTALALTPSQAEYLIDIYSAKLTMSRTVEKILLSLYEGDLLKEKFTDFLKKGIERGYPALYNDICSLMMIPDVISRDPSRQVYATDAYDLRSHPVMTLAVNTVTGFIENLQSNGTFESGPSDDVEKAIPLCLMWALYLRCHLYGMLGRLTEALADIEAAISHTPTSLDCIHKRARILKLCGDFQGAAIAMDYCRSLDLQDRYVNNKATKYFLRANKIPDAQETIALFTKHDGDPEQSLHFIQCIWYAQETADAYFRLENWKMALKKYHAIEEYFDTFIEDQYDFHAFSLRKSTLRAYLDIMETLDSVYSHPSYQAAARGAVRVLLHRIDNPVNVAVDEVTVDMSKMSASQKKKEKAKQRKLKQKLEAEKAEKEREEASKAKESGSKHHIPVDDDPDGDKVWEKDPMEEAVRWAKRIIQHTSPSPDSYDLVCEVMMRKADYQLFMTCIIDGLQLEPRHAKLTFRLVEFAKRFHEGNVDMSEDCSNIVREQLQSLKCENLALLNAYHVDFISAVAAGECTLLHRIFAAKCVLLFDSTALVQAAALLSDEKLWTERGISFKKCMESYRIISNDLCTLEGAADAFHKQIVSRYPLSNISGNDLCLNYTGVVENDLKE